MKLKSGYAIHKDGKDYLLVNDGSDKNAKGMMAFSNETAFFILEQLSKSDGTLTEESLVDIMLEEYDAPREVVERDVKAILEKLLGYGLIE